MRLRLKGEEAIANVFNPGISNPGISNLGILGGLD